MYPDYQTHPTVSQFFFDTRPRETLPIRAGTKETLMALGIAALAFLLFSRF